MDRPSAVLDIASAAAMPEEARYRTRFPATPNTLIMQRTETTGFIWLLATIFRADTAPRRLTATRLTRVALRPPAVIVHRTPATGTHAGGAAINGTDTLSHARHLLDRCSAEAGKFTLPGLTIVSAGQRR
jgi:hypothetical protein